MSWHIVNINMLTATIIDIFILVNILEQLEQANFIWNKR